MSGFGTFGAMFGAGGGQVVAAGGGGGIRGQWGGSNNSGVSVMHHVDLTAVAHDRNGACSVSAEKSEEIGAPWRLFCVQL